MSEAVPGVAEARAALAAIGTLPDAEIDIGAAALQLARIDAPELDWRAGAEHLTALAREAVQAAAADETADAGDAERRRAVLAEVIHGRFGYGGDGETYDDLANANLLRVMERRRGLPVALGILWLHAAEAAGWEAHGLDFPGHFLLALAGRGKVVVDVFAGGEALDARALRATLKRFAGDQAELGPAALAPMDKRGVLLRLQNNIKVRRLRDGDLPGALACTEDMLRIAPEAAPLWREAGLMHQRLDSIGAAIAALERFLVLAPEGLQAMRVRGLLEELRQRLN
ncbi:SirB1 family protein [Falsiroseomonas tokyonensis]|uniref:SirB1 family protein n=1 Tax=Falsiroseomonas tokyonensis TaxID=430521 RepID=A0ABV7BQT5_9PROT|nr:transglutaminase-like domain-containing protein [Falsiroseomonas tokyonensis]MBU8537029.1 transglutaminase family protein [Falsiroseomonas tokyonensis]